MSLQKHLERQREHMYATIEGDATNYDEADAMLAFHELKTMIANSMANLEQGKTVHHRRSI